MEKKEKTLRTIKIAAVALAVLYAVGSFTFFRACPAKDDGSFMVCHYTQITNTLFGVIYVILTVADMLIPEKYGFSKGFAAAVITAAGVITVAMLFVLPFCMMNTMRCHTTLRPFSIVLSLCLIVLETAGCMILSKKNNKRVQ